MSNLGYLLALAIMLSLLLRRSYRYFGKQGSRKIEGLVRVPRPTAAGRWSTNIDSPEQVAKFEVQLQETMRELSAQLDNKMVCLQVLIKQANEKIARLEQLQPAAAVGLGEANAETSAAGGQQLDPLQHEIYALADQGFSPVTIAHRIGHPLHDVEAALRQRTAR